MLRCCVPTFHQCDILSVHYPSVSLFTSDFSTFMQQCLVYLHDFWFWPGISSTKILDSLQPYAMTCTPRKNILVLIAFLYLCFLWIHKVVYVDFPVHMTALSLAGLISTKSFLFCILITYLNVIYYNLHALMVNDLCRGGSTVLYTAYKHRL
jgi:hypothetical protein